MVSRVTFFESKVVAEERVNENNLSRGKIVEESLKEVNSLPVYNINPD